MSNVKGNKRVLYTKEVLRKSLLSLLMEKPIDRITVKDICYTAQLNRGTFYAHYSSPEQLLTQIENEFYIALVSEAATFQQPEDVARIFVKALIFIKDHCEISAALFGPHGDREFLSRIVHVAHDMCLSQWHIISPGVGPELLEYAYSFISYGVMRVVQEWLSAGAVEPPEKLAALMNNMCNYGISSIVDMSKINPPVKNCQF